MAMPGDSAANLIVMQGIMHGMADVCRELLATWILVHHLHARADNHKPPSLRDIAFAGYKEFFRQWMLLGRREDYEPPSDSESPRIHDLWMNCGGSAGHSSLWGLTIDEGSIGRPRWRAEVTSVTEAKATTHERQMNRGIETVKEKIVRALQRSQSGETKNSLRDLTGVKMPLIQSAIDALKDEGTLEGTDLFRSNRKTPYEGFKLAMK